MELSEVAKLVKAKVVCGESKLGSEVKFGFASDLMSDVLTLDTDSLLLLTGMANIQVIRTAEMADIFCIVFVRGKKATPEMVQIANENHIVLMISPFSMFRAVSVLHDAGLSPVY